MRKGVFPISEFAKSTRTTRDTLLHYDKIGLLSPESRGENRYRYYSSRQLSIVHVIRTLQKLGMTLEEIKYLKDRRTPALTNEVFLRKIEKIDDKINDWVRARKLLFALQSAIHSVSDIDEEEIAIKYLPEENIVMGEQCDYSKGKNDFDFFLEFNDYIISEYPDLDSNYPIWAIFSQERIKKGDWVWPDRYYFYSPDGKDVRPAGLYAIGYTRGGYGQSDGLYKRLTAYINENGFEINGDSYEEYPLNEVCIVDEDKYLIRVMIAVKEL